MEQLFGELIQLQAVVQRSLASYFLDVTRSGDWSQGAVVVLLSVVFGLVHAVGPGHGKSIMMAYFLGNDSRARQALTSSLKLSLTHVGSAIVLVLGTLTIIDMSFGFRPADFPLARQISYGGVALVGLVLLIQSLRPPRVETHAHGGGLLPFLAGLTPCPLTTIIMLAASGTGALAFGVLVSLAMASGMVVTVGAFSLAAILARRWMLAASERHISTIIRAGRVFQIIGALAVMMLGVFLLLGELA